MFVLSLYSRAGYLCRFPLSFAIVYARNGGYGTRKSVEYESTFLTSASDAGDSGLLRRNQLSMDRSREKTRWSARNSPVSDWKSHEWCRWMHGSAPLSKVSTFYSREEKIKGKVEEEKVRIMAKISRSFSFQCSLWRTKRASSVSSAWKLAIFIVFEEEQRDERQGREESGAGFAENWSVKRNNEPRNKAGCVFFLSSAKHRSRHIKSMKSSVIRIFWRGNDDSRDRLSKRLVSRSLRKLSKIFEIRRKIERLRVRT